jgi:hypothetical protein
LIRTHQILIAALVIGLVGCINREGEAGPIVLGPDARPIATSRLSPIFWNLTPDAGAFEVDYLHGWEGGSAVSHVTRTGVSELTADSDRFVTRSSGSLSQLRGVGTTFSKWRTSVAVMGRDGEQGGDIVMRLPGRTTAVVLASCFQTSTWSLGAIEHGGFWLALDRATQCGLCSASKDHALVHYDNDGLILSTFCFNAPYASQAILHPTQRFGVLEGANIELFGFEDGGVTPLFKDPTGGGRAAIYPFADEQRVLVMRTSSPWEDMVWADGGYLAPALAPTSVLRVSSLSSMDGKRLDVVQPGTAPGEALVTTRTEDGGQSSRSVTLPDTSSPVQVDYHQGHLSWFFMTEPDDAGMRTLMGQHLD